MAASSDGQLARTQTQLKEASSVAEKVQRLAARDLGPDEVTAAVRYTWVASEPESYWTSANAMIDDLHNRGYDVAEDPNGWQARGYRGRNVVLTSPGGQKFEVQFHTSESLRAAEEAHALYAQSRTSPNCKIAVMMYWVQENGGGRPLLIRAVDDPIENLDTVPEFWHAGKNRWIADEDLGVEMMWANTRRIDKGDVDAVITDQVGRRLPAQAS